VIPLRSPLVAAMCAAALGACSDDGTAPPRVNDGATSVLLTDAPFPYDAVASVNVYIVSVAASRQGAGSAARSVALTSTAADTSGHGGGGNDDWVTIAEPRQRFDLLELQRGRTALVGADKIPAGLYRAVRVVIDASRSDVERTDGSQYPVDWGDSTGTVTLYAAVQEPLGVPDEGAEIVIDFDVGRSFPCADDRCDRLTFTPLLRAVDGAQTGIVSGTVLGETPSGGTTPIPHSTVTVFSGDPSRDPSTWQVYATGKSDENGTFSIHYLLPGTYILQTAAEGRAGTRKNVVVRVGEETGGQDIVLGES
jgi:hypothetical protein